MDQFYLGSSSPRIHSLSLYHLPCDSPGVSETCRPQISITMDLTYVSSDMMLQVKYNPSSVSQSHSPPPPSWTSPHLSPSWLETLYVWAITSLRQSEDDHLIAATIQSELYFSGLFILTADVTDSYPFLGNGTVSEPLVPYVVSALLT